jgi:mRNA-degrading endonuclease toxin of MazEF toxin-antitoxin module
MAVSRGGDLGDVPVRGRRAVNTGDVFWLVFPPGAGRAQSGRRPAIVLQDAAVSARLPTVLVLPLTTQQDALRFPGTVLVEADAENGLRRASVALVFQLTRWISASSKADWDVCLTPCWRRSGRRSMKSPDVLRTDHSRPRSPEPLPNCLPRLNPRKLAAIIQLAR